jgi:beta-1,2-mannosidase
MGMNSKRLNFRIIRLILFLSFGIGLYACSSRRQESVQDIRSTDTLWMMYRFSKHDELFPILKNDTTTFFCPVGKTRVKWRETYVFNPAAVVRDDKVYLLFRGEDKIGKLGGTSRIGIAESNDGIHFNKFPRPVIFPDNDAFLDYEKEGGCEDPRIVESKDETFILTYTAFNGTLARLCVATSKDLYDWEKHGLAFGKVKNGIYKDLWSKSGAIICEMMNDKMIATKINGKYWMYWGETDIYLATSDNLIDWEPVLKEEKTGKKLVAYKGNGQYDVQFDTPKYFFKTAVAIREGRFDSGLVEPGPPALLTNQGIFFIYNACNSGEKGDTRLLPWEYTAGQVLFDPKDPSAILKRCENFFLRAEKKNETTGQMENTAFVEAMIHFNGKWFLYYVMAEAGIGVATFEKNLN